MTYCLSKLYTLSKGIANANELTYLLGKPVSYLHRLSRFLPKKRANVEAVLGWGMKANTRKAQQLATKYQLPYWGLEDGFISYLGHPALGDRRFSLIVDKTGVYYDATRSSDIESLLNETEWFTPELQARSASLINTICKHRISKYNHEPVSSWELDSNSQKRVLVVDQTYGDCSVTYGLADNDSFKAMLQAALDENLESEVWVKVHPDVVLGKKKGYFELEPCGQKIKGFNEPRIKVLAEKVNAQSLFPDFEKVYVVTSQLGFEALWHKKEVVCFGAPFYSNWGLTDDRVVVDRRRQVHTLESLFAAACLKYTRYIDPETGKRCELEDVIELIALQRRYQQQEVNTLYLVGFSLWKRAFLKHFLTGLANDYKYVKSASKASRLAGVGDGILIWGAKDYGFVPSKGVKLYRCEDAFVRGQGLGAELKRPASLVLDRQGIYFDCSHTSDLEGAINAVALTEEQVQQGRSLRQRLLQQRVSKYNLAGKQQNIFAAASAGQKKILVTGQVDTDASIRYGSPDVTSNLELLRKVREHNTDAFIVYKPHPDVVFAGREGFLPEETVLKLADHMAVDGDIFECISQSDEIHVMTSLAGFEALLQSKPVHVWGCPFYAGWSVTTDHFLCSRRGVERSVDELVYFAYIYYSRYINWQTKRFTSPERLMNGLGKESTEERESSRLKRWCARKIRKVSYLVEAFRC